MTGTVHVSSLTTARSVVLTGGVVKTASKPGKASYTAISAS